MVSKASQPRHQLRVTEEQFWDTLESGKPVDRS